MKTETNWIDICRTGTWTAKSGKEVILTESDLDNIIKAYNPDEREAPLVLGHPKDDASDAAFGWATKLRRVGETLQAKLKQVPDKLREMVDEGRYKKISVALFPDMTLRHIGLLGAAQPAVPGMRNVKFANETYTEIEFSIDNKGAAHRAPIKKEDDMEKDQKINELEQKLADGRKELEAAQSERDKAKADKEKSDAALSASRAEQKKKEIEARIDALIEKNNILPADKPAVSSIAMSLGKDSDEIELSAGSGKKPVLDHLFDFLAGLPDRKMLNEFSAPKAGEGDQIDTTDLAKHV